jgi:hypothetical protein
MLSRVAPLRQGLRPLAALGARRSLCAPALPLGEQISADIDDMKAKLALKTSAEGYSPEELKAALEAGKVDTSQLNAAMSNFSEPARKVHHAPSKKMLSSLLCSFLLPLCCHLPLAAVLSGPPPCARRVGDSGGEC